MSGGFGCKAGMEERESVRVLQMKKIGRYNGVLEMVAKMVDAGQWDGLRSAGTRETYMCFLALKSVEVGKAI